MNGPPPDRQRHPDERVAKGVGYEATERGYAFQRPTRRNELHCPDCLSVVVNSAVTHTRLCPVAHALDRVTEADVKWFRRHKSQRTRTRPPAWAEQIEARWSLGGSLREVVVTSLGHGNYSRLYVGNGRSAMSYATRAGAR